LRGPIYSCRANNALPIIRVARILVCQVPRLLAGIRKVNLDAGIVGDDR
jgi:hypothetical protein